MGHINIEIKARCQNQEEIRAALKKCGAEFKGIDHQIDTYFNVQRGRLKLREGNIENFLIYYQREDHKGPKQSSVTLHRTDPQSSLKELLTKALGILVVVDKEREIYFIGNVKFHLDRVKDLGHFVEIEAIDKEGTIRRESLGEQCRKYMELLSINAEDLLRGSYSDLLLIEHSRLQWQRPREDILPEMKKPMNE